MILLLGGTSDSLKIAQELNKANLAFYLSVVSDYGENLATAVTSNVVKGRLSTREMIEFMKKHQITQLIDATHPYAIEVSKNAMTACTQLGTNYLRFERPSLITDEMITVQSIKAACEQALNYSGKIYLTTGSKTLADFLEYLPKERIVARVLPTVEVLKVVEKLEISTGNVEAFKGPFSKELNRELLIHNQAGVMITKESGHAGGFFEKTEACKELNIPCIVIQRKQLDYPEKFSSIEGLIETSKENQLLTKKEER